MKKIIPLLLILVSCSQPRESSNTVILNYDSKLLNSSSEPLSDSLQFQVPVDWSMANSSFTSMIDSTIYQNENIVQKVFQDANEEAFLVCIPNPPHQLSKDSADFKNGMWLALQYSDFEYNDLLFQQTVLQNETVVLFKVNIKKALNTLPISAIHYFIPRNTINSQVRLVESSIASISI